jgi:parvulin-like peptidyl-prolyl isomerase
MRFFSFLLVIIVAGMLAGCDRKPASPVIAQVGNDMLTVEDLYKSIPPEYNAAISRDQYVNYVKQWIDNEVLYQEALRRGIDREKAMRDRLAKMKRDLLCAELISRYAVTGESLAVSEAMIKDYYEQHKDQFKRTKPVVKFLQIVVDDQTLAWTLCAKASVENFAQLAAKYSKVPLEDSAKAPFVAVDNLPGDMGQILMRTRVLGTPEPIKTNLGWHILRLLDKQDKGSRSTLEEARDEIIDRLSAQIQKQEIAKILSDLRLKTTVGFFPDRIPASAGASDSAPVPPAAAPAPAEHAPAPGHQ